MENRTIPEVNIVVPVQSASWGDAEQVQKPMTNRALKLLSSCNGVLMRAKSEQQLLDDCCRLIVESGGYLMAWVGMTEQDKDRNVRPVSWFGYESGYLEQACITWADNKRGCGPTGSAIRTGKIQANQDCLSNSAMEPWREACIENGYQSSISLPLQDGTMTFGALTIYSTEPDAFTTEEVNLLEELAGNLTYGIMHLREHGRRELAEQTLRESEERFRLLVEHAPEAIVVFDVELDRLVNVNANAERLFECGREELLKKSPRDFYPPGQPADVLVEQSFQEHNDRCLRGDLPVFERLVRGAQGRETLCEVRLIGLPAGSRKLVRGSFIDITERKKHQQQQAEHSERIEELSRRLVQLQEAEMKRLSGELHERCSPNLSALKINFRLLADSLSVRAKKEVRQLLEDSSLLLSDTMSAIREICAELRPAALDYAGLWPALDGYTRHFSRRTGIAVQFAGERVELNCTQDVEFKLFRIVQEALTNCAKHAHARTVRITFSRIDEKVILTVGDDGVGFDVDELGKEGREVGLGLITMRERAEFSGGKFTLEASPGHGTCIRVELPA